MGVMGFAVQWMSAGSGPQLPELGLHHGPEVPWGVVMELEDPARLAVEHDGHATTHIACNDTHGKP